MGNIIGKVETLKKKRNIFDKEFNEIVDKIDKDNWILGNAVRSVVSAGFFKKELENIKIKNVLQNKTVVSKINPFLPKTKKAHSSMSIILDEESKEIIEDHIKKLGDEEFDVSGDSPLFPDIGTKKQYNTRTFGRHFKKYFEDITFDDLRAYGYQRRDEQLKRMPISDSKRKEELRKFSRHSRISTTKKLISGDVQKAGKPKKEELPWERIVKSIENLSIKNEKEELLENLKNIRDNISEIKESDVKESLYRLLKEYIVRYNISTKKDMDK